MKRTKWLLLALGLLAAPYALGLAQPLGGIRSFVVTLSSDSPTLIKDPAGIASYNAVACHNPSSTEAYFGGPDVDPANGYEICSGSGCAGTEIRVDGRSLYGTTDPDSDGGTLTLDVKCITGR
jgi:hypothetical protein